MGLLKNLFDRMKPAHPENAQRREGHGMGYEDLESHKELKERQLSGANGPDAQPKRDQ